MLKKNEEYIVKIIDTGFEGEGIAKIDGAVIFIPGAIIGEEVKIKILKVTSSCCYAKVLEIISKSEFRKESDCNTYPRYGGCNLRHIDYQKTIEMKKQSVEVTLKKALKRDIKVVEAISMENPLYYINKLQYPIGVDESGEPVMGVFAQRTHKIIPTNNCKIQNLKCQEIANDIFEFAKQNKIPAYNEQTLKGILRHLVIRIGVKTNEIMVTLVVNDLKIPKEKELVEYIASKYSEVKTIVKNLNNQNTNVILGNKCETIYGNGYIFDYLGDKKFKISPLSFYQVNPIQTKKLYDKAKEYIGSANILFDLYCGIGTIGIYCSDIASKVYGIEIVSQAIDNARENAKINNVENIEFLVGKAEDKIDELYNKNILADTVLVDPPRKGLDKKLIDTLLEKEPNKIVYISCNNATLARDLKMLEEKYELKECTLVDMFPHTSHVECVAALKLK